MNYTTNAGSYSTLNRYGEVANKLAEYKKSAYDIPLKFYLTFLEHHKHVGPNGENDTTFNSVEFIQFISNMVKAMAPAFLYKITRDGEITTDGLITFCTDYIDDIRKVFNTYGRIYNKYWNDIPDVYCDDLDILFDVALSYASVLLALDTKGVTAAYQCLIGTESLLAKHHNDNK